MALTDCYEPFSFDDLDGPGCGSAAHGPSCLCDVVAPEPSASTQTYVGGWHELATRVAGVPSTGAELERWAGELFGLLDAVQGFDETKLTAARSSLLVRTATGAAKGRYAWRSEVLAALAQGLDLVAAAHHLGIGVADAVRAITQQDSTPLPAYLEAERLLREGARSLGSVAMATGLSRFVIRGLSEAIGVATVTKALRASGGGDKYTADQYAAVIRLRAEGLSYGKIEKLTGVERTAAFRIHQRRAV